MTLILRKCAKNGHSRNNFYYGKVGERVYCPDWNAKPSCGNGLHGLKEGIGNWDLLDGEDWLVIDADDQIVDIDSEKCKFNTGVILFRGSESEFFNTEYFHKLTENEQFVFEWASLYKKYQNLLFNYIKTSNYALNWARKFGNNDVMISKIDNAKDAYNWAIRFGDEDVMYSKIDTSEYAYYWMKWFDIDRELISKIDNSMHAYWCARDIAYCKNTSDYRNILINKITESNYAYKWALNIGDRDIMIDRINTTADAYEWAVNIGNRDIMINRINTSEHAFYWANGFGNEDVMIDKVTDSYWAYKWALHIGNRDVMINRINTSDSAYYWAINIGDEDVMKPKVLEKYSIIAWNCHFKNNKIESN